MRRILIILLLIAALIAFATRIGQMEQFVAAVQAGQANWIAAAAVVQLAWQMLMAEQFCAAHTLAGSPQRLKAIIPVALANNFVLVAAPSGSVSTFALFLADARRRGLNPPNVALGVALFAVAEAISLTIICAIALALNAGGSTFAVETLPALAMMGLTLIYVIGLVLGMWAPARLESIVIAVLGPVNRVANRLLKKDAISEATLRQFMRTWAEGLAQLKHQPVMRWLMPLLVALVAKAAMMGVLALSGLALGQVVPLPVLVMGVAIASTLTIVSPTPLGIGVVEGALAYVLAGSGVDTERALLIALLYRGFILWLPMVYGFAALQVSGLSAMLGKEVRTTEEV